MNPLDKYIVRGIGKWWTAGQVLFSLLYLMSQLIRVAPLFADTGAASLLSPGIFGAVVPVWAWSLLPSFMVAIFMQAADMAARGELTAISAAGIRTFRLARWPIVLSLVFCGVSVWAWNWAVPVTQHLFHDTVKQVMARGMVESLGPGIFHQPVEGVVFYANGMDGDGQYRGVYLEQTREGHSRILVAERARVQLLSGREALQIGLRGGELVLPGKQLSVVSFDEMVFRVDLGRALQASMRHFSPVEASASSELFRKVRAGSARRAESFEFFQRLLRPVEGLIMVLVSLVLAFRISWKYRFPAIAVSVAMFVVSQVLQRALEVAMQTERLSPWMAASIPAGVFLVAGGVIGVWVLLPKRSASLLVVKK